MLWHKNGPPTKLSPAELSDWKQKVKLQQMNSKQRAAWRTKMDQENLEELENVFLELAQTLAATTSEEPSGAAINLRSVNSQPPVPDELVIAVAELDLFEGVLQHPSQFTGFATGASQLAGDDWNVLTEFFRPVDGDIATDFYWRTNPRRDRATLENREVFVIPDVGTDQGAQTEEPARHAIGIQVSPLCSEKNATSHQVLVRSDCRQGAWVGSTDYRRCGGSASWSNPGERFRRRNRRQLKVIVASCIVGMRTFVRGLQDRYEQMISSLMAGSAQALVSDLVDEADSRSFGDVETGSSFHCIHELKRIPLDGPRAGNKVALFEAECWCHVHFGHISTQNTVLLLLFFGTDILILICCRLNVYFSCCPVIVPSDPANITVHRFDCNNHFSSVINFVLRFSK